ncbi:MAG TPA: protein-methionine-sulfoxide reductase heme-binding subunit MsrQ [Gammaproteobacteria bacterium]|jgi:sulfoxide reductase heme-binding subunit YedZ
MRDRDKAGVFALALVPLGILIWRGVTGGFSANPIEDITHFTGDWTLRFLLVALSVTPLRRLTGWNRLIRYRRMLGLFAFFYASLHFLTWLVIDQFFDWDEIVKDIVKRPFITVGFTAFVLLIPLAATSNNRMVQKLGAHWRTLHKLVYIIATLGVLHFLWLVKADIREPVIYGVILITLLVLRLPLPKRHSDR